MAQSRVCLTVCGIAGWYRRGGREVPRHSVVRQCDTIVHRGPDDSGVLVDGDFGFGMRRLSIIDIAGGHQPIDSADGRYAIVFNGEIYNHPDLRRELEARGVRFATHSDTETLLASFVEWGDDAWLRLQGMYAAAIWDRKTRTLTLARDPLGIKPLYLTEQHGGLAFASEIRALRVLPEHRFDIDERAVHDFFSFGHVQRPRAIFRQVRSLDPGHVLRIGPAGEAEVRAFWQPRFRVVGGRSERDWIEETRARVQHTVERHMLADVTVGAFLSGGVDSSAITAAMTRVATAPVKAFTVGFPGTSIDETAAAARIARHLGCEHIVLPLEPTAAGDLLPAVQAAFDEPCAATAAVPIWHLSKLAAEHVKVVLCGEGSDEIFAGYKRQRTALSAARWSPLMRALRPLATLAGAVPASSPRWNYLRQNAKRFGDAAMLDNSYQRFFAGTQISSPAVRARLYEPGFLARQEGPDAFARLEQEYFADAEAQRLAGLQQFMLADITVHMPGSLLNRLDRASMAHSLEARVPFLSHDFVDWSLTMPEEMKLHGKVGKFALRQAVEPWLPPAALDKRKLGFQLPFAEWFRGDFADFARMAWHDSGADRSGYLRPQAVEELFVEHSAGLANHGRILYAIAMFACWWQDTMGQRAGAGRAATPC
ncbi:MAG: asparagine synthase (glutamine-hydrolyzing) [Novosphingobium sp.]